MARFFTSDTHFSHKNIIAYCDRPFDDWHHMNEVLIKNWNAVVGPTDVVYHLGDVALGDFTTWDNILTRLNGYKVLVIGNHDRVFAGNKEKVINRFYNDYAKWFDEVEDNFSITLENGMKVNLSHFPYDGDHTDEDRYSEFRLRDEGVPLIHGHTHLPDIFSRSKKGTPQVHVGVDAHSYGPVAEANVIKFFDNKSD